MLTAELKRAMELAESRQFHGLLYQHAPLCATRVWLHYHYVDCGHLNRHMQHGLVIHELADRGQLDKISGLGIQPDAVDFAHHRIDEVKSSRKHNPSYILQLSFYLAVLELATGVSWEGRLRYMSTRRIITVVLDSKLQESLTQITHDLVGIVDQVDPPRPERKPICHECSYSLLCWGQSTEDVD